MLKEISPERSLEGLMLKLKLQYFGHLMRRTDSQEKTPRSGEGGDRGCDGWQPWPKEHEQSLGDGDGEAWCAAAHAVRCEELDTTERLDKNTAVGRLRSPSARVFPCARPPRSLASPGPALG